MLQSKSLVVTSLVKFNPLTLVITYEYEVISPTSISRLNFISLKASKYALKAFNELDPDPLNLNKTLGIYWLMKKSLESRLLEQKTQQLVLIRLIRLNFVSANLC